MEGFNIQYQRLVSPISGFFGVSIQDKTNVLITIKGEDGIPISGVTVSYPGVTFTTSSLNTIYKLSVPINTATSITLSKIGYNTQTFSVTLAANEFRVVERVLVLSIIPYEIIIRR